jgi:serine phosphatase RsbU (regulator of sigma subunit)
VAIFIGYRISKSRIDLLVVAADCTGHGVPGAFMSMLGTSFLNEIVAKLDVVHSEDVLNLLRENVITTLSQGFKNEEEEETKRWNGYGTGIN